MEVEALDRVVKETFNAIERGQDAIYDIAENTRCELERVQQDLITTQCETLETVQEIDKLTRLEKQSQLSLVDVSCNLHQYDEVMVKEVSGVSMDLQVCLLALQEQENNLRRRRMELERSMKRLSRTVEKAETLITKTSIVLQFFQGALAQINVKLDDLQKQDEGFKIILAQEEERRRLSREIHDGPAQAMANIVLRAEYCEQLLIHEPKQLKSELEELKDLTRSTLQDIRRIIFDLRPMALDDLGLAGGVRRLLEDLKERHSLSVKLLLFGSERRYSRTLELAVFRIIQEAVNNVQKHAESSGATVKLELHPQQVLAVIQDDGKGFDPEMAMENKEHYGLLNMRERAQVLKGDLQVNSVLGKGTEINVVIPVGEEGRTHGENKSSYC